MTKIIELRPDKTLINSNFEKYQFSPDIIPIASEITLKTEVLRQELNANQESWLETRLFAFHNHLFKNPYDTSCWFVDKKWEIWKLNKEGMLKQVHSLNVCDPNSLRLYNPSIGFTSKKIAVVTDGSNHLEILVEDPSEAVKCFIPDKIEPGIILDVQFVEKTSLLMVIMCAVVNDTRKKCTQLTLLTYSWKDPGGNDEKFCFVNKQILRVQGTVEYACIEENGEYFHSICQDIIMFQTDNSSNIETEIADVNEKTEIKIPKYYWSQDEDSLTVWVKIPEKYRHKQPKVLVKPIEISVTIDDIVLIQGECQHRLDEKLATWKHEQDTLRIDVVKSESGLMWNELIRDDTGGECLPNESLAAEIHSRLAHLCTDQQEGRSGNQPCIGFNAEQLEECDLEGRENLLQRFNLVTRENTNKSILGNNHVLFTYKTKYGQAICLRHDHDGCLWMTRQSNSAEWHLEHMCTFPGLGYIEAGKSNKKFCVSPPSDSYVAIVEHTRHVLIYEKPEIDARIGKQWIVDLGCEVSPTMGAVATNKYLIVLTKDKLYRLQIHEY